MFVGVVVAEAILIARTFAIYSRSYPVLAFLVIMRVGTLAGSLYITEQWNKHMTFSPSPVPTILPCVFLADGAADAWIDFLFIAIFDSFIVILTIYKAISLWRSGISKANLMTTIYRDGMGYFVVLFVVSVTNSVLLKVEGDRGSAYFDFFGLFQRVVQAILSSRIIINVRKALVSPTDQFMVSDPLGGTVRTGISSAGGSAFHPTTVAVHTSTLLHGDADMEMNWSPVSDRTKKEAYP